MSDHLDLDVLQALCDAATPSPWMQASHRVEFIDGYIVCSSRDTAQCRTDAAFIASSREAFPRLIAEVKRLRERETTRKIQEEREDKIRRGVPPDWPEHEMLTGMPVDE